MLLLPIAYAAPMQVHSKDVDRVPRVELAGPDRLALALEDDDRALDALPPRFAEARSVSYSPDEDGDWEQLKSGEWMWRLRVSAPGAAHLNFGFTTYWMPEGGSLQVTSADGYEAISRPFTDRDNKDHGELWTPVLLGDDALLEVIVPEHAVLDLELELTTIGVGYQGFGAEGGDKAGSCNVDVTCEEGDDWWDEIPSVAVMGMGGSTFCTGFLLNNIEEDETPYFQTAQHCGLSSRNAGSLITYWHYQRETCDTGRGRFDAFNTGSTFLVDGGNSDFALVELDEKPDPELQISYAGFDATGEDATLAVGIHHPSTDEKAISISYDGTSRTGYYSYNGGNGSHVMVRRWDVGTTEGGSSGSPLFNEDHRVIGQLHGGYASCNSNDADWYGSMETSWDAGLDEYLDPEGTGERVVDTLAPWARGLDIAPESGITARGQAGGPFTPDGASYTLTNDGDEDVDYEVSVDAGWVALSTTSGSVPAGEELELEVSFGPAAASLSTGLYTATVTVAWDDDGEDTREVTLQVGEREDVLTWDMETEPDWNADGGWAWGIPEGQRGTMGLPDPESGATGDYVFGYELGGGYDAFMDEEHLVAGPFDLRGYAGTELRFQRWLGVEGPPYDAASLAVSVDGSDYETIWEADSEIDDGAWVQVDYDLSAWDDEAQVWIRWTMGSTDKDVEFCGWNIDDVTVSAIVAGNGGVDKAFDDDAAACGGCASGGAVGWLGLLGALGLVRRRR